MVAARNQRGSVFEHDPKRPLLGLPVRQDGGADVPSVVTADDSPVDHIAGPEFDERACRPIAHENPRFPRKAVRARVETSPVRVDAPAEADVGTVVVREDLARVVLVHFELRRRDLLQVFDVRREPRIGRIGDGPGNHGRRSMYLNLRSGKPAENPLPVAPTSATRRRQQEERPCRAGRRRSGKAI